MVIELIVIGKTDSKEVAVGRKRTQPACEFLLQIRGHDPLPDIRNTKNSASNSSAFAEGEAILRQL